MDVCEWLDFYRKADELISGKKAEKQRLLDERQRLMDIATETSAKMPDGMPHSNTGTVSQKMQNAVIAKIIVDGEIKNVENAIKTYLDFQKEVITAIEKLPEKQYGVLHRYYIRGMTYSAIAADMGKSTVQIWRIKKKALENLENVIECNGVSVL